MTHIPPIAVGDVVYPRTRPDLAQLRPLVVAIDAN
jgi:hypothetical protein